MAFLSTAQLCELSAASLGSRVSVDECLQGWHCVGKVVLKQLSSGRGVRLPALGTFTMTPSGIPTFVASQEMVKNYKLKVRPNDAAGNIPVTSLNFSQLSQFSGLSRELCEKIYVSITKILGKSILEGRDVLLTVHKVAELSVQHGVISCNFMKSDTPSSPGREANGGALSSPRSAVRAQAEARVSAQKAALYPGGDEGTGGPWDRDRQRAMARKKKQAAEEKALEQVLAYKAAQPEPQVVMKNNIFSTDSDNGLPTPPKRAAQLKAGVVATGPLHRQAVDGRRPASAADSSSVLSMSTSDLFHSPRSAHSDTMQYQQPQREAGDLVHALVRPAGTEVSQKSSWMPTKDNCDDAVAARAFDVKALILRVREKIIERGGSNGIRSLQRLLAIMDDNGDKRLSKSELKYGLRDYGITLSEDEMENFLVGIRGDLNDRRKKCIRMAFDILDSDGSGYITIEEIADVYDVSHHPDVTMGKKTEKEALLEFMGQWETGEKDGVVTYEEFENYYKDISASIDEDDYFELMIRNAWRISGGEGYAANTANLRVLVTDKDGKQKVATVEKELGLKQGDREEIRKRLMAQGVDASNVELYGGIDTREKPKAVRGGAAPASASARPSAPASKAGAVANPRSRVAAAGDKVNVKSAPSNYDRNKARAKVGLPPMGTIFDSIQKIIYSPPVTVEELGNTLMVSAVTFVPRISRGAFISRITVLSPTCNKNEASEMWKAIDPKNVGSIEVKELHSLFASRYGKDKKSASEGAAGGIIQRVIARILSRCGEKAGIKGLQRTLMIMDDSGDKKLDKNELKYGLRDYGIELNIRELDEIFSYFDRDRNGVIDITEFLVGVRGDLNDRRKKCIRMAFDILDSDGSGYITIEEIADVYDVSHHPDVTMGKKTEKEALLEFMGQWETGEKDGVVTYEEFENYYKEISASIDGDDYFELMIRNAWRIAGGEGYAANTANLRVLVTDKDGKQKVATVEKELGLKQGDREEIRKRLMAQGVDASNVELYGGIDTREKPKAVPGVNVGNPRSAYARNVAAMKLAAAFRGRVGRKKAEAEKRKIDARQRAEAEAEAEANIPRAKKLIRPVPKTRRRM
eukprot:GSChrysophyteH1.ASY1.ANO1.1205.1 assembled CDS